MSEALTELGRLRAAYGRGHGKRKRELVLDLAERRLGSADEVARLHDALLFLSALPDDAALLRAVRSTLERFDQRPDVARFREALENSGIAGTTIRFPFFHYTARWLVERWPGRLTIDWPTWEVKERLEELLPHLLPYCETLTLDTLTYAPREWLKRLRGPRETDAAFLVRRLSAVRASSFVRESVHNALAIPLVLSPGPDTPARSRAFRAPRSMAFQRKPLRTDRPDLLRAMMKPPVSVRDVPPREAERWIDLARASMVTRARDLDAFEKADPRDVRLIDCGDGLAFACFGVVPSRRLLLESVYGFLTLKNGVPIGYVLASALFGSSEVAYNVFETWRGAESAHVYGRILGMLHRLFGSTTFAVDPYQLGHDNEEGQQSGAWWFYYKLGFRPRDAHTRALAKRELARLAKNPDYRSSPANIHRLAASYMFLSKGGARPDVLGALPLERVGLALSRFLAEGWGADRERAIEDCSARVRDLLGMDPRERFSLEEQRWCHRLTPLFCALPGIGRMSRAERQALLPLIRAKAGRRESDFVPLFDRHVALRKAIVRLALRGPRV